MLTKFFGRLRTIRRLELTNESSSIRFAKNVELHCQKTSKISIGGVVRIGYPLPGVGDFPSYNKSVIYLGENSKFTVFGNLFIAPGCSIRVGDGASLQFGGENILRIILQFFVPVRLKLKRAPRFRGGLRLLMTIVMNFDLRVGKLTEEYPIL
ncbi:MAG: hypothetical protein A2428_07075 [Bdellovibrionales bacterium RIFOXYC1_FULL_54_43]|nr:MAG: hypothetical protein A2428_07075 [Bdellovibrionales bacterium RIFOXYC1_FULL_54_43]OFZ82310.1 MAG: hypothetical protein A2603_07605 [Bdellovibrionales bacterium RIFOXYD1_FULL_55_31]